MPMQVRLGGAWQTIKTMNVYAGGAWRNIKSVKVYANGAWRDVARFVQPLTLAITPSPFSGHTSGTIATSTVTATPTGGSAPFTYAWSVVSGAVTLGSPTLATTAVSGNVSGGNISATLHCVATDSFGTTATANVSGTLVFRDTSGVGGTL